MSAIDRRKLLEWCSIPVDELEKHNPRVPFEIVKSRETTPRTAGPGRSFPAVRCAGTSRSPG